jgi:hypothetical protein
VAEAAQSLDRLIGVYPTQLTNSETLNLDFYFENEGMLKIRVFDIGGKMVKDFSFVGNHGQNHFQLALGGIASGTFIVEMNSETSHFTQKIIIK